MSEPRWQDVLALMSRPYSEAQMAVVLDTLLSHEERSALAARLAILRALMKGEQSQRQIAAELGVSFATITRASNNLKSQNDDQRAAIADLLAE